MRFKFLPFLLANAILASSHFADAKEPLKIPRIGYVSGTGDLSNPGANTEAFQEGLRALGYIEGKNIQLEYRYIQGKRDQCLKRLWPNWCNLKSISSSLELKSDERSAQPSRPPRRFLLYSLRPRIQSRPVLSKA